MLTNSMIHPPALKRQKTTGEQPQKPGYAPPVFRQEDDVSSVNSQEGDLANYDEVGGTYDEPSQTQSRETEERESAHKSHMSAPKYTPPRAVYSGDPVRTIKLLPQEGEAVFFWKAPSPFSHWTLSAFEVDGVKYRCVEQYMQASKARLFDESKLDEIMRANSAFEHYEIGKTVENFNKSAWEERAVDFALIANLEKFSQNPKYKKELLDTGDRELVACHALDSFWGIGLDARDVRAADMSKWRGKNILGNVLMQVRSMLAEQRKMVRRD